MTGTIDEAGFLDLVAPLRGELHAHCYRMLGSVHDADDALQETLVKAWRGASSFEGRSSLRTWLYRVATHCCLDAVRARGRRALPVDLGPAAPATLVADVARTDVAWLGPYPTPPDARAEQREAVELAFVAALQHLPGNQRAALLLAEVLGLSAAEVAATLQTTTASVNSALQRARATVGTALPVTPRADRDRRTRDLAARLATALEHGDADAVVALLAVDVTWSMPPLPGWYAGRSAVADFVRRVPLGACGSWRARLVEVNGAPGLALWLRPPGGRTHDAWAVNATTADATGITAVTSFLDPGLFPRFGLPSALA